MRVASREASTVTPSEGSPLGEEADKKKNAFSREFAWMICEYSKVSHTDESVLDLNETLKVELKDDNVQSFNTRWDEDHHRDEEAARRRNTGALVLSLASTVSAAEAIAVSVHSKWWIWGPHQTEQDGVPELRAESL